MRETGDLLMEIGLGGEPSQVGCSGRAWCPARAHPMRCGSELSKSLHRALGLDSLQELAPNYFFFLLLYLSTLRLHKNLYRAYSLFKKSNEGSALKRAGPGP